MLQTNILAVVQIYFISAPAIQQEEEDGLSSSLQDKNAVPSTSMQKPTFRDKGLLAKVARAAF